METRLLPKRASPPRRRPISGERGTMLLELAVGSLIGILVLGLLSSSVVQFFNGILYDRARLTGIDEVERAVRVITPDIQMAEATDLVDCSPASTITLTYTDRETEELSSVTYSVVGMSLERSRGGTSRILARNIVDLSFSCAGQLFTVAVTSKPEDNPTSQVTSTWEVMKRTTQE